MQPDDEGPAIPVFQRRRSDHLNDRDVRERVQFQEELTGPERFVRRLAAQKKALGFFLLGVGATLLPVVMAYPAKWLIALVGALNAAGGTLVGGGSASIKSDEYDQVKNLLLKQRGLM